MGSRGAEIDRVKRGSRCLRGMGDQSFYHLHGYEFLFVTPQQFLGGFDRGNHVITLYNRGVTTTVVVPG